MRKLLHYSRYLLLPALILASVSNYAQVAEMWVRKYHGSGYGNNLPSSIGIDKWGNVYVTGQSYNTGSGYDYATVKYDPSGTKLWVSTYNGPANGTDQAIGIALDSFGNVYVTGWSTGDNSRYDYATIKYDNNGVEQWVRRYNGTGNADDQPSAIAVDPGGAASVTGWSTGPKGDNHYLTIRYDTAGNLVWSKTYSSPVKWYDEAKSLAVDSKGNTYVTGFSLISRTTYNMEYATIKYNAQGKEQWVARYQGPNSRSNDPSAIAVDSSGNVYVTGGTYSETNHGDFATVKYDSTGEQQWVEYYNGPLNYIDAGSRLFVDNKGNVTVSGTSAGKFVSTEWANTRNDIVTIRYDKNGTQLWMKRYEGQKGNGAAPLGMVADTAGNIYITGYSRNSFDEETNFDWVTLKYDVNGNKRWIMTYAKQGSYGGWGGALGVDKKSNVYVTGYSFSESNGFDYTTIKYVQQQAKPLLVDAGANKTLYRGYGSPCMLLSASVKGGTAPYTYKWSPGGATTKTVNECPKTATTYTVTVTDTQGNTGSDQVTVKVIDVRCGKKGDKVQVCHKGKSLCIAAAAVASHLNHGDQLGACTMDASITSMHKSSPFTNSIEELKVTAAPNPFNSAAQIHYSMPSDGRVRIQVYDLLGRLTATLVNAAQKAGAYSTAFDGTSRPAGLYYYRVTLTTGKQVLEKTGKLLLVK